MPFAGDVVDGINALIYLARGQHAEAAMSAAAMVPFGGIVSTGLRLSKRLGKLFKGGRAGKQARLRALGADPKVSSSARGWIQQEINSIERGQRSSIRVPPGKNLAHRRGFEAKKGCSYEHSDLQDIDLHKLQHKHEGY